MTQIDVYGWETGNLYANVQRTEHYVSLGKIKMGPFTLPGFTDKERALAEAVPSVVHTAAETYWEKGNHSHTIAALGVLTNFINPAELQHDHEDMSKVLAATPQEEVIGLVYRGVAALKEDVVKNPLNYGDLKTAKTYEKNLDWFGSMLVLSVGTPNPKEFRINERGTLHKV